MLYLFDYILADTHCTCTNAQSINSIAKSKCIIVGFVHECALLALKNDMMENC